MIHRSQIKLSHHNKTLQEEENTSCWMSKTRHYTLRYKLLRPWVGTGSQTPSVSEDWNELQSASRQSFLDVAWLHGAPDSFASYYSSNLNRTKLRAPKKRNCDISHYRGYARVMTNSKMTEVICAMEHDELYLLYTFAWLCLKTLLVAEVQ